MLVKLFAEAVRFEAATDVCHVHEFVQCLRWMGRTCRLTRVARGPAANARNPEPHSTK
jgi:hypothetical protein